LLFAVLVMQGVLFLSAHNRWFWFNERKGYTVLISVAGTAIALMLLAGFVVASRFFKSKSQFSLATLLLAVPIMAIPCGWLAREMEQASHQRDLTKKFTRFETDPDDVSENWITKMLGVDFFRDVTRLALDESFTDADLELLKGLPQLQLLWLEGAQITDAGLEHLKGLARLQDLGLEGTQVTDAGLEHLKGLSRLKDLGLGGTQVTDAGLKSLEGLTQLQVIWLKETQVTDAGIDRLKVALPKCGVIR
jgi:hypothetical protein